MKYKLLIPETVNRNNFDLMRVLLASSVILCHCYATYYGWEKFAKLEPFMKWSGGKISIGSAAVDFFFVISGFLILRSFEYSSGFGDYIKKRILRIYPGFIVAFVFSFIVFGPIGHMKELSLNSYFDFIKFVPAKRELANMFTLQSPIEKIYFTQLPQSGLNNSLWTIHYEFICYLFIPFIAWFGFSKSKWWFLVAFFISYTLLVLQYSGYIFPFNQKLSGGIMGNPYYYPRFFTYFLSGCLIYAFRNSIPRTFLLAALSLILFILAFKWRLIDVTWPVAGAYFLFYMAYNPKILFPDFAKYGDFSYGIYLYGWPLQQLVMMFFGMHLNLYTFFLTVFPLILFFAFLSWNLIEGPTLKLKRKKLIFRKSLQRA